MRDKVARRSSLLKFLSLSEFRCIALINCFESFFLFYVSSKNSLIEEARSTEIGV
ncbi:MAG: hypothetical protein CM15mP86_00110 [Gammaproteobacteria bacterium]|nr:MAG: hypothetical protein CM15mP86_00110 [Gammaproteobacteria bacterium]